jgi:hypothetical protein
MRLRSTPDKATSRNVGRPRLQAQNPQQYTTLCTISFSIMTKVSLNPASTKIIWSTSYRITIEIHNSLGQASGAPLLGISNYGATGVENLRRIAHLPLWDAHPSSRISLLPVCGWQLPRITLNTCLGMGKFLEFVIWSDLIIIEVIDGLLGYPVFKNCDQCIERCLMLRTDHTFYPILAFSAGHIDQFFSLNASCLYGNLDGL